MSEQDKALDNLMSWQQEFEKQTPVAWMRRMDGRIIRITPERVRETDEPLYTSPQIRALSDDEIVEIWGCAEYSIDHDYDGAIRFARAILKKASEKC